MDNVLGIVVALSMGPDFNVIFRKKNKQTWKSKESSGPREVLCMKCFAQLYFCNSSQMNGGTMTGAKYITYV